MTATSPAQRDGILTAQGIILHSAQGSRIQTCRMLESGAFKPVMRVVCRNACYLKATPIRHDWGQSLAPGPYHQAPLSIPLRRQSASKISHHGAKAIEGTYDLSHALHILISHFAINPSLLHLSSRFPHRTPNPSATQPCRKTLIRNFHNPTPDEPTYFHQTHPSTSTSPRRFHSTSHQ